MVISKFKRIIAKSCVVFLKIELIALQTISVTQIKFVYSTGR
ncbi:hypothetical protein SAMN05421640_3785 [Ekhidna lutea]|uniref:Uncharacterized protein n=1 Tax=Ekhidna lutea TaxID=447679 RepID=A0A239MBQ4_EKHLU|nr:hypothetical protein SAMN05421640_3785 [Ekhidna lutea]